MEAGDWDRGPCQLFSYLISPSMCKATLSGAWTFVHCQKLSGHLCCVLIMGKFVCEQSKVRVTLKNCP